MTHMTLVVDDDPAQRRLMQAMAERAGFQTMTVASGQEALDLLRSPKGENVSLVLLDLIMPGMDGLAVLRELRPSRPSLPVIVLTAPGGVDTAVAAMRAGADEFLVNAQYSGGDHCCTVATVLELGKESVRVMGRIGGLDGLPFEGLELRKVDKDSAWEIVIHQAFRTLCGGHEDAADVPSIYGYVNGQYIDQTAKHVDYLKGLLQQDLQKWGHEKDRSVRLLQTIAAGHSLLGEREAGKRYFAMNLPSLLPDLREKGIDPNACLDDAQALFDRLPSLVQ